MRQFCRSGAFYSPFNGCRVDNAIKKIMGYKNE
jgi:hypothetical protein